MAPWEGRVFGIAVNLNEQGLYPWSAFRDRLVVKIGSAEEKGQESSYYERWLATLENLLLEKGMVTKEELSKRTEEYASGTRDDDWDHEDHH
jgi:nitrile hydratase accessory protein